MHLCCSPETQCWLRKFHHKSFLRCFQIGSNELCNRKVLELIEMNRVVISASLRWSYRGWGIVWAARRIYYRKWCTLRTKAIWFCSAGTFSYSTTYWFSIGLCTALLLLLPMGDRDSRYSKKVTLTYWLKLNEQRIHRERLSIKHIKKRKV